MQDTHSAKVYHWGDYLILGVLMLFSAAFSVVFMRTQGLGLDEAQSLWQSAHTFSGILYVVAQDVHVPLYHFMLHLWQIAFGNGVPASRALSLLFFLPTIPLIYVLGRISFSNRSIGLWAAAFFALSPFTNWYGSVIRMYSLLALITVINQIFFVLIFKGDKERTSLYWFGFAVSGLFGVYTHYFFFFTLIVEAAFFFIYRARFPKGALRNVILIALIIALAFIPWLWYAKSIPGGFGAYTEPKLAPPTTVDVFNALSNFLFGFQSDAVNAVILSLWPIIILLLFLALQKNRRVPVETIFFAMFAIVPIVIAALLSYVISPFFVSRYFIGILPSFCLIAAWVVSMYPRPASMTVKIALVAAMIIALGVQTSNAMSPIKEDYKDVGNYLNENVSGRDVIALSTPFTIYPVEYYYDGAAQIVTIPDWDRLQAGPIPAFSESDLAQEVAALAPTHDKLWLVLSYDQGYESQILDYFNDHYQLLSSSTFSPDLSVRSYQIRYGSEATMSSTLSLASTALVSGGANAAAWIKPLKGMAR